MIIHWKYTCNFIFQTWASDTVPEFLLGSILSSIIIFLTIALPVYQKKLKNIFSTPNQDINQMSPSEYIFFFVYYFIYAWLHIAAMMLIMTFNGYLLIFLVVTYSIGYFMYGLQCDKDKQMGVNCCA